MTLKSNGGNARSFMLMNEEPIRMCVCVLRPAFLLVPQNQFENTLKYQSNAIKRLLIWTLRFLELSINSSFKLGTTRISFGRGHLQFLLEFYLELVILVLF